MRARIIIGALAFVALMALDWFLLAVAFLYAPTDMIVAAEWIGSIGLLAMVIAVATRWRWLLFAVQSGMTILLATRIVQTLLSPYEQYNDVGLPSLLFGLFTIVAINFLAWLVARGLPQSSWSTVFRRDHSAVGR